MFKAAAFEKVFPFKSFLTLIILIHRHSIKIRPVFMNTESVHRNHLFIGAEESSNPGSFPNRDCLCLCRVPISGEHPRLELCVHLLLGGGHLVLRLLLSQHPPPPHLPSGGVGCLSVWCSYIPASSLPWGLWKQEQGQRRQTRENILYFK